MVHEETQVTWIESNYILYIIVCRNIENSYHVVIIFLTLPNLNVILLRTHYIDYLLHHKSLQGVD